MTRRLLSVALLCYLGLAAWILTARFTAWGDGLSSVVGQVVQGWTLPPPSDPAAGGIDFVIVCGPSYEGNGMALVMAALFFGCTPLALAGHGVRRRRLRIQTVPDAGLAQIGALLQVTGVMLSPPVAALATMTLADTGWVLTSGATVVMAVALSNIALGVPAFYAWRHDHARAFGAPRPLLVVA